jgi:hypothetical protein
MVRNRHSGIHISPVPLVMDYSGIVLCSYTENTLVCTIAHGTRRFLLNTINASLRILTSPLVTK